MKIFFDLDGTLIDSRLRLYRLFCNLTAQSSISFEKYWELKRAMRNQHWLLINLLHYSETQAAVFKKQWLAEIEKEEYLCMDELFPFTKATLNKLKEKEIAMFIVTARQNKINTLKQLNNLDILNYFEDCIIASPPVTKKEGILSRKLALNSNDILIGDTVEDIKTAQELNLKSVAVLTGFHGYAGLNDSGPDLITEDISQTDSYLSIFSVK